MRVSMTIIRDIVYGSIRCGADASELYKRIGLSEENLSDIKATLNLEQAQNVWQEAVNLTKDDLLGLHIGESSTPSIVGLVGHLMQSSPTLKDAFESLCKFNTLVTDVFTYRIFSEKGNFIIEFEPHEIWQENYPETAKQAVMQAMSGSLHVCQLLTGKKLIPQKAEFAWNTPKIKTEYERIFGQNLHFNKDENRLYLRSEDAQLAVIGYNRELQEFFQSLLKKALEEVQNQETIAAMVKRLLADTFTDHLPSLHEIANKLHLTSRSLQRKLKDENTSYQELTDELRRDLAIGLLRSHKYTINEIAYRLGYAEPSVFRRAFKRWTGNNPSKYEAKNLSQ
ncbi:MAG: AraC family transcriptional regulator [Chitinophagaceae bacterium]|nr:MAG: AraC family transcriptional regulator [Chitinophagaceae bacterium]